MNNLVISYLNLRKLIGMMGLFLPLGLVILGGFQSSLSAYYYTDARDWFVGVLIAIGTYLFTYRGYDIRDKIYTTVAGCSAVLVAMVPTPHTLHYIAAIVLFVCMGCLALFQFTKTGQAFPDDKKLKSNKIYRICGLTIFVSIALIFIVPSLMFILETIAVLSFAISWLVKGKLFMV